jgi:hypothetical protein
MSSSVEKANVYSWRLSFPRDSGVLSLETAEHGRAQVLSTEHSNYLRSSWFQKSMSSQFQRICAVHLMACIMTFVDEYAWRAGKAL